MAETKSFVGTADASLHPSKGGPPSHAKLFRDRAFWGITATQFLGAFNDNLFKQLVLLLSVPVATATLENSTVDAHDQQGIATMVFSLPFVLFSGVAGWLSDRYSKRTVICLAKAAEIVVMALGMFAFLSYGHVGYTGLLTVLALMGLHSTFFGPGKYGILPELFREEDLPKANGVIVMTTFMAIILGTAGAGGIKFLAGDASLSPEQTATGLWKGSLICIGIAVIGTWTSLWIRRVPASEPGLFLTWDAALGCGREVRGALARDRHLIQALLATCVFWLTSGIAIQAVNALGKGQLGENDFWTSILVALIGLGIALGAVIAGKFSRGAGDFRFARLGSWGLVVAALPFALTRQPLGHWLGYRGVAALLVVLGMSAGMFAIPVQVFLQSRAPAGLKGRVIALMNQSNFIAVFCAGWFYEFASYVIESWHGPRSWMFAVMAAIMLPVALFYGPPAEARK